MAFDMYAGDRRERIESHEEFLFSLASDAPNYPELSALWENFYNSPRLSPQQANAVVHELIALLAANGGNTNKVLNSVVGRLLPFFSAACRNGHEIRCSSD